MDFIVELPMSNGVDAIVSICWQAQQIGAFALTTKNVDATDASWLFFDTVLFKHHGL